MSKINDFLNELEKELIYLKPKDASEVLKFYRDKINVAMDYEDDENKIISTLPTPKKIAEDIYKSKGKDFLTKRKKQVNTSAKIKAILSIGLVLAIVAFLFTITIFVFSALLQLFKLIRMSFITNDLVDILTLDLFLLAYILVLGIIYIYFFDLMYILISHFIYPFLYEFVKKDKEYKALSFTISGLIEKIFKKKGILGKVLLVIFVALIVFAISNIVTKGYIYRSINDEVSLVEEVVIEDYIDEIKINESTTFVKVFYGDVNNLTLKYYNEFKDELKYSITDNDLVIDSIKQNLFDLFGILDEPLSKLEIILPINNNLKKLDISLNMGYFDIVDYKGNLYLDIKGTNSTYAITRSNFDSLIVDGYNLNVACEDNKISNADIKLEDGKVNFVKNEITNLVVNNHLVDLIIQDANIDNINISSVSSRTVLDKINASEITFKDRNSESSLQYIYATNANVSSYGSSDVEIYKSIFEGTLSLDNSIGNFDLSYIKANNIVTEFESGNVEMYYINRNVIDARDDFLIKYNEFISKSNFVFSTYKTKVVITSSSFNDVSCDFKEGSVKINASYLADTNMHFIDTYVNFIDVDGIKMNVDVNGGSFAFDDENIKTDIVVCVTGEIIKTDIYISETIKRGETCEE